MKSIARRILLLVLMSLLPLILGFSIVLWAFSHQIAQGKESHIKAKAQIIAE